MPKYKLSLMRRGEQIETMIELPTDGVYFAPVGPTFVAARGVIRPVASVQRRHVQRLSRRRREPPPIR